MSSIIQQSFDLDFGVEFCTTMDMSTFDSLTWAFEDWFDTPLQDLPPALQERAKREFVPMSWESLAGDQRRSMALQLDYQHDPSTEKEQGFWFDFVDRQHLLQDQLARWTNIATPTAGELALKEARLDELRSEIAKMSQLLKKQQGDYYPARPTTPSAETLDAKYIPYPKAMGRLFDKLTATPEELAAWVWLGPDAGGLAAYLNANELSPPPRFFFATGGDPDYVAALMPCWFEEHAVTDFDPAERYMTGEALISRWRGNPVLKPVPFIKAKISESRLDDLHPIYGATRGTFDDEPDWPALETGLFSLSQVEAIEDGDFEYIESPAKRGGKKAEPKTDSPAPLPQAARQDSGQPSEVRLSPRLSARKLATQKLHEAWQVAYRRSKKKSLGKTDVWHSIQIAKLPVAEGRTSETIRKFMTK